MGGFGSRSELIRHIVREYIRTTPVSGLNASGSACDRASPIPLRIPLSSSNAAWAWDEFCKDVIVAAKTECGCQTEEPLKGTCSVAGVLARLCVTDHAAVAMAPQVGKALSAAGWRIVRPRMNGEQVRRWRPVDRRPVSAWAADAEINH